MDYTKDCGDHSCILRDRLKPVGMRTNGGCRHLAERGPDANAQRRALGAEVVRLRRIEEAAARFCKARTPGYYNAIEEFDSEEALRKLVRP